jgi:hypothetical protein
MAKASEQHGGGRPGDSSADDDDIVTAAVRGLHGHLPPCQYYTQVSDQSIDRPILTNLAT